MHESNNNYKERIIVALDVPTAQDAKEIISDLKGEAVAFKVGLQLFTSAGPEFVREIVEQGIRVFLDLKFHDIPTTVAKASVEAARLGVWMFNMHASGGREMMKTSFEAVRDVCEKEKLIRPKMIAVTVLTSSNKETLEEAGVVADLESHVVNLAKIVSECGLDGVVASAREASAIRESVADKNFLIVTPGIRPSFATTDDQKRVTLPAEAFAAGSDYIVIGRPITEAADRAKAFQRIVRELKN